MYKTDSILFKNREIEINLHIYLFKEGDYYICYSPTLKISDFGYDENEAFEMFKAQVKIFIDDLIEKGNLEAVLKELGWSKNSKKRTSPDVDKLVKDKKLLNLLAENQKNISFKAFRE